MPLTLRSRLDSPLPVEVEGVLPETTRGQSLAAIERMLIWRGNRQLPLAELFDVSGTADDRHEWQGDLACVHWLGAHLSTGSIHVEGRVGRHLGSQQRGGEITVAGDAGDWVGAEARGGRIRVRGSAGHLVGAAYRGSPRGVRGGVILIHGDAGDEIGHTMRRGLVAVGGRVGDLVGFNMFAGTVLVVGAAGARHGAGMRRGSLVFCGRPAPPRLPSFRAAGRCRLIALRLLLTHLKRLEFPLPEDLPERDFALYHGDVLAGGRGELLLTT